VIATGFVAAKAATPDELPESVRAMYREIIAELENRGLKYFDTRQIRAYCQQMAIAEMAAADVFENGTTVSTLSGGVKANPSVAIMRDASTQALRIAEAYGITLAARLRLGLASASSVSGLQSIRNELDAMRAARLEGANG